MSARAGVILDAEAEVLLNARSGIMVRGVAVVAALAARAMLRENILDEARMTEAVDVFGIRSQGLTSRTDKY